MAIIQEVSERRQKDNLPALKDIPKKKLLEQTAKVDKVLCKVKTHSMKNTSELFHIGDAVVTNRNQCGGGDNKIRLKSWGKT